MYRPAGSWIHRGERDGKHKGSEGTSKGNTHFLDHIKQTIEARSGKKIVLSIHAYKYSS